jgi:hypothetical protein
MMFIINKKLKMTRRLNIEMYSEYQCIISAIFLFIFILYIIDDANGKIDKTVLVISTYLIFYIIIFLTRISYEFLIYFFLIIIILSLLNIKLLTKIKLRLE